MHFVNPPTSRFPELGDSVDIDLLKARERLRYVKATERLAELAELNLAAQNRAANALENDGRAVRWMHRRRLVAMRGRNVR